MKNLVRNLLIILAKLAQLPTLSRAQVALALLITAKYSYADPQQSVANQRSTLPGARAAMMGGAYTALADDATGAYYNPAGLSFADDKRFELSATAMRSTRTVYKDAVNSQPFVEGSQEIYPSFIGGTTRFGALSLGYAFITLDARSAYQQSRFAVPEGRYSRTYQEASTYIWAGGSAALQLSERFSWGTSVFYYQRDIKFSTHELIELNQSVRTITGSLSALNTGLAVVTGFIWRSKNWSLGTAVRGARAFSDDVLLHEDIVDADAILGSAPVVSSSRDDYKRLYELNPPTYSLGAAWFPWRYLTLSADVHMHEGVKSPYTAAGGHDLHSVLNYSAGLELRMGSLSLLGGWLTNRSMNPSPDPSATDQPAAIDYVGVTGGFGWELGRLHGQVGSMHQWGQGRSQIRAGSHEIQDVEATTSTYVISGKVPL